MQFRHDYILLLAPATDASVCAPVMLKTLRSKAKVERDLFRSRPLLTFIQPPSIFFRMHAVRLLSLLLRFLEYRYRLSSLFLSFPLSLSLSSFLSLPLV